MVNSKKDYLQTKTKHAQTKPAYILDPKCCVFLERRHSELEKGTFKKFIPMHTGQNLGCTDCAEIFSDIIER